MAQKRESCLRIELAGPVFSRGLRDTSGPSPASLSANTDDPVSSGLSVMEPSEGSWSSMGRVPCG